MQRLSDYWVSIMGGSVTFVLMTMGVVMANWPPDDAYASKEAWTGAFVALGVMGLVIVAIQADRSQKAQEATDAKLTVLLKHAKGQAGPRLSMSTGVLASGKRIADTDLTIRNTSSVHPLHLRFSGMEDNNSCPLVAMPQNLEPTDENIVRSLNTAPIKILPLQDATVPLRLARWIADESDKAVQHLTLEAKDEGSGQVFRLRLPGSMAWPDGGAEALPVRESLG